MESLFCTEGEAVEGARGTESQTVKSLKLKHCSSYTVLPYLLVYISKSVMVVEAVFR